MEFDNVFDIPSPTGARSGASLTRAGSALYLFGGSGFEGIESADAGTGTGAGTAVGTSSAALPHSGAGSPRGGGGGAAALPRFKAGGSGSHGYLQDLYVYDLITGYWAQPVCRGKAPNKRVHHSAITVGPFLLIHGGTNNSRLMNDVYLLHTPTKTWSMPDLGGVVPSPRMNPSLLFSKPHNKMIVFGGGTWVCEEMADDFEDHEGDVFVFEP